MAHDRGKAEWERDIAARQRNVVFPDTVQNEARLWRNLGSQPWTSATKIGISILALFAFGFLLSFVLPVTQEGHALEMALYMIVIWLPVFGGIAWATRRALRAASKHRK